MLIPTQQRDPRWAGTTVGAHSTPHPQASAHASSGRAAWPEPRAFARTPLALLTQPVHTVPRRLGVDQRFVQDPPKM
eukprot:92886-Prymnesium_polylepis.1